jgi:hypothetical protein
MNYSLAFGAGKAKNERDTGLKPLTELVYNTSLTFICKICSRNPTASKYQLFDPLKCMRLLQRYFPHLRSKTC